MKTPMKIRLSVVVMTVFLAMFAAFIPQIRANTTLTNGLIGYWPMDATNGGVLTPDLSGHGYDLQPWKTTTLSQFTNGTAYLVQGIRSNAIELTNGTLLAYECGPSDLVPLNANWTNYTVSFWYRNWSNSEVAGSLRLYAEANDQVNNPFIDSETEGAGSKAWGIVSRQQSAARANLSNFGSGGTAQIPTNTAVASAIDGTWHNITWEETLTTNRTAPILVASNLAPDANGTVNLSWSAIPLDSLATNWFWQIDTNSEQRYVVQASTDLHNPAAWVNVSTNTSGAALTAAALLSPSNTFATISNVNINARFYRIVQPLIAYEKNTFIVDGTNVDNSPPNYRPEVNIGGPGYMTPSFGTTAKVWDLNTIAFGGFFRQGSGGNNGSENTGDFDDAAMWNRTLSLADLADYIRDGITNAPGGSPLTITVSAAFPAVASNDTVNLSFKASANSTGISISPNVGSVFPEAVQGQGSTNGVGTTVNSNITYSAVATRSTLSVTSTVSVVCISNINPGWHYIDDFRLYSQGPINLDGNWRDPANGIANASSLAALQVRSDGVGGNNISFDGDTNIGGFAVNNISSWASTLNNSNSLFFRFYIDPSYESGVKIPGVVPDIDIVVGIVDGTRANGFRDVADLSSDDNSGPGFRIFRSSGQLGGPIDLVTANGPLAEALTPDGYSYVADSVNNPNYSPTETAGLDGGPPGNGNGLIPGHTYAVWINIQNLTNTVVSGVETAGDLWDLWIQDETISGPRTQLLGGSGEQTFTSSQNDANSDSSETLDTLFLDMNYAAPARPAAGNQFSDGSFAAVVPTFAATNIVRFDDFFISVNGSGPGGGFNGIHTDKPIPGTSGQP